MQTVSSILPALEPLAASLGALRIGASPLGDEHVESFRAWLNAGREASMSYLRKSLAVREKPSERWPWARSAIVITVPYSPERDAPESETISSRIARYAQGDDYHEVLDTLLRRIETRVVELAPGARTWRYVDTGPLSDRSLAAQAGLGWIGRNAMLIDPSHGSFFFIGLLLTSLEYDIEVDRVTDRCGNCTRCIDACPTAAILPDRSVDSTLCISYATIEHRGPMPDSVAEHLEGNVFGCDICQEVCPWNSFVGDGLEPFRTRDGYHARPVTDLLRLQQTELSALFRKSAVRRAKRAGIIRNTILAADGAELDGIDGSDEGIADALRRRR
jgi:epoxyqueuosine reductase